MGQSHPTNFLLNITGTSLKASHCFLCSSLQSSFMATFAVTAGTPVVKVLPNFRMIVSLTTQIPLGTKTKLSQPFHNNPQILLHSILLFAKSFSNHTCSYSISLPKHTWTHPQNYFWYNGSLSNCILHYITRSWIQRTVVPWLTLHCQPKFPWFLSRTLNQIPDKHSWQPKLMFSLTVTCS